MKAIRIVRLILTLVAVGVGHGIALLLVFVAALHAQTPHTVTLTWSWSQCNTATPPVCGGVATGFQVQRATTTGGPYTTIGTVTSPTTLTYVDTSGTGNVLTEGATYYYVVEATGNGGTISAPSPQASALIPFLPASTPTALSAVAK